MPADPSPLLANASCFNNCIPPGMQLATMNYLLYHILLSGAGGGGSSVIWRYWEDAHADDNPPVNPLFAVERRFRNGDTPVTWDPGTGAWQ